MDGVVDDVAADQRARGSLEGAGARPRSLLPNGQRQVRVHFYGPKPCPKAKECVACKARCWLWHTFVGYVIHCDVEVDEFLYECTPTGGCRIKLEFMRKQEPLVSVSVVTDELDCSIWYPPRWEFTFWPTVLHWIRLRRSDAGVMNCVQATRMLIGEERKARTAQELYQLLNRSTCHDA